MQTARGELLDVDSRTNRITIKTETGEMTFRFNDQTKVTGAQKGVAGLATMTGSEVSVMFRKDGQANLRRRSTSRRTRRRSSTSRM